MGERKRKTYEKEEYKWDKERKSISGVKRGRVFKSEDGAEEKTRKHKRREQRQEKKTDIAR